MTPPEFISVIDKHGGFTAESQMPYFMRGSRQVLSDRIGTIKRFDMTARKNAQARAQWRLVHDRRSLQLPIGDTLWRPGHLLKKDVVGHLLAFDEDSFFQTNNNVTVALYRVPGYGYPVVLWFDNSSGERIA